MTDIASPLHALRQALSGLGLSVALGRPTGAADITIWPWQLREASGFGGGTASTAPAPPTGDTRASTVEILFLLVSTGGEGALAALHEAHRALMAQPVVSIEGQTCQLFADSVSTADTAALFTAAQVPLTLSAAYRLRCTDRS